MPPPQDIAGKIVDYSLKVDSSQGTLRLTRKLSIDILMLENKYYTALRQFFQTVRTNDGVQIVLQPGEIHASN